MNIADEQIATFLDETPLGVSPSISKVLLRVASRKRRRAVLAAGGVLVAGLALSIMVQQDPDGSLVVATESTIGAPDNATASSLSTTTNGPTASEAPEFAALLLPSSSWEITRLEGFPLDELFGEEFLEISSTNMEGQFVVVVNDGCNQLRNVTVIEQDGLRLLSVDEGGDPGVVAGVGCDRERNELMRFAMQPQFTDIPSLIGVSILNDDHLRFSRGSLFLEAQRTPNK